MFASSPFFRDASQGGVEVRRHRRQGRVLTRECLDEAARLLLLLIIIIIIIFLLLLILLVRELAAAPQAEAPELPLGADEWGSL